MMNAILVLRIHLYELEKVNELCNDFADRYIETLKIKLNSDNIFKMDDEDDENEQEAGGENGEKDEDDNNDDENELIDVEENGDANKSAVHKTKKNKKSAKKAKNSKKKFNEMNMQLKKMLNNQINGGGGDRKSKGSSGGDAPAEKLFKISPDTSLAKIKLDMLNCSGDERPTLNSTFDNYARSSTMDDEEDEETLNVVDETNDEMDNDDLSDDMDPESQDDDEDELSTKSPVSTYAGKSSTSSGSNQNLKYLEDAQNKAKRGILPKIATNVMKKWLFQHLVVSVFFLTQ